MTNNTETKPKHDLFLRLFKAVVTLSAVGYLAFFVYGNATNENSAKPFKLGLDLAGGSHLVYEADISKVDPLEVPELMSVLRDVIEERINIFGVSEPIVYVESSSFVSDERRERLVVELPGVTDVAQAVAEIGRTPLLEFKLVNSEAMAARDAFLINLNDTEISSSSVEEAMALTEAAYSDTGLTGRYLETARMEFVGGGNTGQLANEPVVSIKFNSEGADLFAQITRDNVGKQLAIFLDGNVISSPRINESIVGGTAIISGGFTATEARDLAQNLSFGALPLPIELQSTQVVGATLGQEVLEKGVKAGLLGFGLVLIFMLVWYRLPGLVAILALASYVIVMLALFQLIPVTLTAAGLAGFVISLGMAVDANILVYERMKEEMLTGKTSHAAAREGFSRAWGAIRDSNITSLLSAIILFWFGTSMVKGFALVFGIGIVASMLSAIVITRNLLLTLPDVKREDSRLWSVLFGSGFLK
jgi:preprotein translocase subunit SecD